MGWSIKANERKEEYEKSIRNLRYIENCFVRKNHICGKVIGASKSCFIASPDEPELETILQLIVEKLARRGIESVIAVRERAYGQDIFCTKICGKIIESKFCIVILDDTIKKKVHLPNPNVYYEYGLMTALTKQIIPLQKKELTLAFNIQSHDTIKYSEKNISTELDTAIKEALRIIDIDSQKDLLDERRIFRVFELNGFQHHSKRWAYKEAIDDTEFVGLVRSGEKIWTYILVGKADRKEELPKLLDDLEIIAHRIERICETIVKEREQYVESLIAKKTQGIKLSKEEEELSYNSLVVKSSKKFYVTVFANPDVDIAEFMKSANRILDPYKRFEIVQIKENKIIAGDLVIDFERVSPE